MSEVRYRIHSVAELPQRMLGELSYDDAYDLVCNWNDQHPIEDMAWLVRCDDGRSSD